MQVKAGQWWTVSRIEGDYEPTPGLGFLILEVDEGSGDIVYLILCDPLDNGHVTGEPIRWCNGVAVLAGKRDYYTLHTGIL